MISKEKRFNAAEGFINLAGLRDRLPDQGQKTKEANDQAGKEANAGAIASFERKNREYKRLDDAVAQDIIERRLGPEKIKCLIESIIDKEWSKRHLSLNLEYIEFMIPDLARLLLELEPDLASYDTIISDDSSGRLPSLLFRKIINKKRQALDLPRVKVSFISNGRSQGDRPDLRAIRLMKLCRFFEKKREEIGRALLVTEYIDSGNSINGLVRVLEAAGIDFDLAAISTRYEIGEYGSKALAKHLRYGGVSEGGLFFHRHFGSGVIRDSLANEDANEGLHPLSRKKYLETLGRPDSAKQAANEQSLINLARENISFLADGLYPLVK